MLIAIKPFRTLVFLLIPDQIKHKSLDIMLLEKLQRILTYSRTKAADYISAIIRAYSSVILVP